MPYSYHWKQLSVDTVLHLRNLGLKSKSQNAISAKELQWLIWSTSQHLGMQILVNLPVLKLPPSLEMEVSWTPLVG